MVSREEIRWAYKTLLGREPESEDAYRHHSTYADFEGLRCAVMCSEEGLASLRRKMNPAIGALPFDYFRLVTVFIHIQKTGGTAVHEWLCTVTQASAASDAHTAYLPSYTLGELNRLDLVSGHFSFQEAMAVPRETKRVICCFREPVARLVSLYRFHRAHQIGPNTGYLTASAQRFTVEEFFADEQVRASSEIDNRYLRVLCDGGGPEDGGRVARQENLALAMDRLARLDAVVIAEQMERSASTILKKFGFASLPPPARIHVTDELHKQGGFRKVEPIVLTDRLQALLAPLVKYDVGIYEQACRMLDAQ